MRFLPTRIHGMMDYLMGALLIALPFVSRHPLGAAAWIPFGLGVSAILYSLLTDYELGFLAVIPMPVHLGIDAVSGLLLSGAFAQSTTPPADQPAASPPSATAPAAQPPMAAPAQNAAPKADMSKVRVINAQSPDQWLASKCKGTDVVGADDQKIGDVNDIVFDKNGKIVAYVVGVGGFLGIGAKDVAIAPASFQTVPGKDANDFKLRLSMTKEELKAAPAFEPYQPPRPVSSQNAPTRPAGAPSPMAPTSKQ